MKIAHIVASLEERHGGPSKSVRSLVAAQLALGESVELFATAGRGDVLPASATAGVPLRLCSRGWPDVVCASGELRHALREAAPAIAHHHGLWLRTLHYARKASPSTRLVISPRGMMGGWAWHHHGLKKRLARCLVHPGAFAHAAGWHATSEREAQEIRARGFAQPICVAPNGVSEPAPAAVVEARRHWELACPETARRRIGLFYGRFHRKKRLLELIDCWIERAPSDWLLLVVGIPEEYSVDMLEDYVLRSFGSGRVRVFNGLGRPPPYAVASLFLLASHNENFGLSISEALAHGVPVLVTDGTPWAGVRGAAAGWCVPWEEFPEALTAATREAPAELAARGERARRWVLDAYSWARPARQLAEFYRRLGPGAAPS